jgi:TonB-linked SusC/RagA family outer membrane protein
MRLIIFFILFGLLQVHASVYSQQTKLQIAAENKSVLEVLKMIEEQSDFHFLYRSDNLKGISVNEIDMKDARLEEILDKILIPHGLTYEIEDRTIVIKKLTGDPKPILQKQQQRKEISGIVRDSKGATLPGVTVAVKSTSVGTITGSQGEFKLLIPANAKTLLFTFVGMKGQEVEIGTKTTFNITLSDDEVALGEVVVIGYGTVRKKDLTGAVSVVKMADIENAPVVRVDQMLQGRIAGADIMSTSGEPGAETSIRIRGTRSISATNEPLYVVDGVLDAITNLNDLNPGDIASLQVLKDASSTAIYGSRGSNGVIVITTKTGVSGKTNYSFRADAGYSQLPEFLDLMNATEFANLQNDRFYFTAGANQSKTLEEYPYKDPIGLGEGTNWTKEITRTAPYQNYTFSASGGDKSSNFYFSGNYNDTKGIILNSGLKRYQSRFNFDKTLNKFVKAGIRLNYSFIDQELNKAEIGTTSLWYRSSIFLAPTIAAYKPDGSLNDFNTQWYSGTLFDSPLAYSLLEKRRQLNKTLSSNLFLEISPVKSVKIKSSVSYYDNNRLYDRFVPGTMPTRMSKNTGAYANKQSYLNNNVLNENTISYKNNWGKHNFDAIYGITFQDLWSSSLTGSGDGYFIDAIEENDLTAIPSKENLTLGSSRESQKKISNLARVNYNYNGKYYLTLTGRADAASSFAADHKWGYFPSTAVKWNVHEEKFMKNLKKIDELAIRFSAGVSGNDAISKYQSLSRLASSSSGYLFSGAIPVSYSPSRISNEDLTWEKTTSYNIGFDLSILKNRFLVTFDAYKSYTSDLLLTVQLPTQVGYDSRLTNIGKTSNKGMELSIESRNITRKNFSWSTTLTFATNTQMVDDIGGLDRISAYVNPYGGQYMMYGYVKGRPLNAIWGMQYAGVWKSQAEITQDQTDKKYASAAPNFYSPGRQRYIDQNGDGNLTNEDLVYLGNSDPDLYGGVQNNIRFHGFNLGVYLNYSIGGKIYNPTELFAGSGTYLTNQFKYMVNAWHPIRNPNSDYPRADSKDDIPCDRFVHDASFLRIKNVSIGYTFDVSKKTNNKLKSLSLSLSGNNLFLWKYYNGYDPEVSTQSGGSTIRRMDNGAYPNSRTMIFSAELKF